jgi:hypothetical protein
VKIETDFSISVSEDDRGRPLLGLAKDNGSETGGGHLDRGWPRATGRRPQPLYLLARFITENQNLSASQLLGLSTNSHNNLRSWNAKASYYYNQTIGVTGGYFQIDGSSDPLLFGGVSAGNSPRTSGWIGELNFIPFNYGGPSFWPWLNMKLGLQYVHYNRFNGGNVNFDGAGRNAGDNNTLLLYAWTAF